MTAVQPPRRRRYTSLCDKLVSRQRKIHRDLRIDLNRIAIQNVRPISPLLHCIDSGGNQHRMTAQHAQIFNRAFFADYSRKRNRALNARLSRQGRIFWLHAVNQQAIHHDRDADCPLNGRRWW